jgi:Acyl-CoA carboxylase epsilon subunit
MTIRVERGDPTPEELAALVGVLLPAVSSTSEPSQEVSAWWRSGLPVRRPRWRQSGLPRMSQW